MGNSLKLVAVIFCFIFSSNLKAQDKQLSNDLSEINSVITNLYKVISGPAGKRDWDYFKSLFQENGTMGSIQILDDGTRKFRFLDLDSYINSSGAFFEKNGFYEEEIGREVKIFGGVAQVFTAYQFRLNDNPEIAQRGINCIQLVFDTGRWYITNIVWEGETDGNKIPEKLIKN
ncbi:hypothetical protein GTQ40_10870 [Flavobacteriaceae bacterium R38]|nr:hypothetical protein [Flavobacteriaceae bacterium R38]